MEGTALFRAFTADVAARCSALWGMSRKNIRMAVSELEPAADPHASASEGGRIVSAKVLMLCRRSMEQFSPEPEGGWLDYIYRYLADGLYPDEQFPKPTVGQRRAVALYVSAYEALLDGEQERCAFDMLSDVRPVTEDELAHSDTADEYLRFRAEIERGHYIALLRIGRDIMRFDPASHTIGVHNVAVHMARLARLAGLPADVPLISAAALSHDIGKIGCRGKDAARIPFLHYYYTWQWLADASMPAIAHIAANHSTWDLEFENLQLESLILIYADFRVRGVRDASGAERVSIYPLERAFDVIFGKLYDMTEEKSRRYRTVYAKLRDFESFLASRGASSDLSVDELLPHADLDPALLAPRDAESALRNLIFSNNIALMRMLAHSESFSELLEQARSEKNLHRIRTYLALFEEYSTYMTRDHKLRTLSFLYELLMHREGDVRRNAGRIMGQILANSGPRYRKELPEDVARRKTAMAPTVMALLQESTDLWERHIELCLHPDVKISAKHSQRIANSLKTVAQSLFNSCDASEARHYLAPLYSRIIAARGDDRFVLVDTLLQVPFELFTDEELARVAQKLKSALAEDDERLRIAALNCLCKLARRGAAAEPALDALNALKCTHAADSYLAARARSLLTGEEFAFQPDNLSDIFLSNLKNAVHWTVKQVQVDVLCAYARAHGDSAFQIALHLSNLLCVSEHLPVREHAGKQLVELAPLLSVEQNNEIVVDLIRELETGQSEVARFISPCVGRLMCRLPKKEFDECMDELDALERGSNLQSATAALRTLSVVLYTIAIGEGAQFEPAHVSRILGLILTGVAHYDDSISTVALEVLCRDFFRNAFVPLDARRKVFPVVAKKLRALLAERRSGKLVFFNQAAMLNCLYRFMTQCEVQCGGFDFEPPRPVAFFPGTFDPFSRGHKRIVEEIRQLGFDVYLAVDEFSWSKRTLAHLLRRQIVCISTADFTDVFLFPDDMPVNLANPADICRLQALFPGRELYIVAGSDVIRNASAYSSGATDGAAKCNHIVFTRDEDEASPASAPLSETIRGKLITLALPAYYESVSSSRIREYIDKGLDISMLIDPVAQEFIYSRGLYLRSEQLKRVTSPDELRFEPADGGRAIITRKGEEQVGRASAVTLSPSELYDALGDLAAAERVRLAVSGKLLFINRVELAGDDFEERLLLVSELLARSLAEGHTYALCRCRDDHELRDTLAELGFAPIEGTDVLCTDMRLPSALTLDVLERVKPHLAQEGDVVRMTVEGLGDLVGGPPPPEACYMRAVSRRAAAVLQQRHTQQRAGAARARRRRRRELRRQAARARHVRPLRQDTRGQHSAKRRNKVPARRQGVQRRCVGLHHKRSGGLLLHTQPGAHAEVVQSPRDARRRHTAQRLPREQARPAAARGRRGYKPGGRGHIIRQGPRLDARARA
ncbi:MAG: hypothetical protein Q4B99_04475 [Clostridia bacterium]|nr:hypothetical protein [Clostridia bacterium]